MFIPVDSKGNVELVYDQNNYDGFFEVKYDLNSSMVEGLGEIIGITDHFPPLSDDSIVFRSFETLENYLSNPVNVDILMMTSTYSFKDPFKQLIWDLGQIAIKCKTKDIELDTRIDRIFVVGNDTPQVKAIAFVGIGDEKWTDKLVKLYGEMKNKCQVHGVGDKKDDANFIDFLKELGGSSSSLRATQNVFQSHFFFWSKYKKLRVLDKLEDMVDRCTETFAKVVNEGDLTELLTWRQKISSDPVIGGQLFMNAQPRQGSQTEEVDFMLKYMRSNISHFRLLMLRKTRFTNVLEVVEYYDMAFPTIMSVIYKGCKAMSTFNMYRFDLL